MNFIKYLLCVLEEKNKNNPLSEYLRYTSLASFHRVAPSGAYIFSQHLGFGMIRVRAHAESLISCPISLPFIFFILRAKLRPVTRASPRLPDDGQRKSSGYRRASASGRRTRRQSTQAWGRSPPAGHFGAGR